MCRVRPNLSSAKSLRLGGRHGESRPKILTILSDSSATGRIEKFVAEQCSDLNRPSAARQASNSGGAGSSSERTAPTGPRSAQDQTVRAARQAGQTALLGHSPTQSIGPGLWRRCGFWVATCVRRSWTHAMLRVCICRRKLFGGSFSAASSVHLPSNSPRPSCCS